MRRAPFFAFEGGDGAGKSTQINRLKDALEADGLNVIVTREPGGTPGAEEIRQLIVTGHADRFDARTEMLLVYAARADHLARLINPARAAGTVVITDRFSDSTRAYQGFAGGLDLAMIDALDRLIVGDDGPDLTFVLDLPVDIGLGRALRADNQETRFEDRGRSFQDRVRAGFLTIAKASPETHRIIDAARAPEAIARDIAAAAAPLLAQWKDERPR